MVIPGFNPDAVRAFLSKSSQIHLAAIPALGGVPFTRNFEMNIDAAIKWAGEYNTQNYGIYWTVNRVADDFHGKPSKKDIIATRYLHIDIDPPKDGGVWDKTAALARLQSYASPPTFIIDSGNGYQAFWRLADNDLTHEAVEAANAVLRDTLGGDACHNIDRLMRVPGFINWPNAKKQAAGRTPVQTSIVQTDDGAVYDNAWAVALAESYTAPSKATVSTTELSNIPLETCQSLSIPFSVLQLAIELPRGEDRSSDCLRAVRAARAYGLTDTHIAGLLLNPDNAVSAHILDQQNPSRAVQRALDNTLKGAVSLKQNAPMSFGDMAFIFDGDSELTAPSWLIKGVLPHKGIGFIGGQSGAGKSFVAVDLAVALATRDEKGFFGKAIKRKAGVAIIAAEGGGGIACRLEAARRQRGASRNLPIAFSSTATNLSAIGAIDTLISILQDIAVRFQKERDAILSVIIIDTLAAAFGLQDENSNAEAATVMRKLQEIADALNCVVIAVHHYGKSADVGLRGASAFRAGADFVLAVHADRDGSGNTRNRRVAIEKSRDGEEGPLSGFDLGYTVLGNDNDNGQWGSCHISLNDNAFVRPRKTKKADTVFETTFNKTSANGKALISEFKTQFEVDYQANGKDPAGAKRKAFDRTIKELPHGYALSDCKNYILVSPDSTEK